MPDRASRLGALVTAAVQSGAALVAVVVACGWAVGVARDAACGCRVQIVGGRGPPPAWQAGLWAFVWIASWVAPARRAGLRAGGEGRVGAGVGERVAVPAPPVSLTPTYLIVSAVPDAPAADGVSWCQVQSEGLSSFQFSCLADDLTFPEEGDALSWYLIRLSGGGLRDARCECRRYVQITGSAA
ncbi:hypothetical protein GCM10010430_80470 [Kitasatospora cystarginea]|uniref:Uncharacterized protein n=1 Tax=Kitasatospora cystarginea TaxID=58350 RepID=A0ABP5RZG6_9ACTN